MPRRRSMEKSELSEEASVGPRVGGALLIIILLALSTGLGFGAVHAAPSLRGVVVDDEGSPIPGSAVSVWSGMELVASGTTGWDGRFEIPVREDRRYSVYVLADDPATPGVDYMPSRRDASPSDGELSFVLSPAASLVLSGDIMFVESEELPYSIQYSVHSPGSEEALNPLGLPLIYGTSPESQSKPLGLPPSKLVVPVGVPLALRINCSVLVERGLSPRVIWIGPIPPLAKGEMRVLDVRRFTVGFNLDLAERLGREVKSRIGEMEALGFYLTAEKGVVSEADRHLSEARKLLDEGDYVESFTLAKKGYLLLRQTLNDLIGMARDASASLYIIIFFLALSSTSTAFLIFEGDRGKLLGSLGDHGGKTGHRQDPLAGHQGRAQPLHPHGVEPLVPLVPGHMIGLDLGSMGGQDLDQLCIHPGRTGGRVDEGGQVSPTRHSHRVLGRAVALPVAVAVLAEGQRLLVTPHELGGGHRDVPEGQPLLLDGRERRRQIL